MAGVSRRAVTWTWDLDCSCKCQSLVLRITYRSLGIPSDVTLPPPLPLAPPARAPRCSPPPSLPPASPTRTTSSLWPLPSRHCFHHSPAWPSLAVAATTRRRCRYRPPPPPPGYRRPPGAAAASPLPLRTSPPSSLWHKLSPLLQPLSSRRRGRLPVPPPSAIGALLPHCCPAAPVVARPTGRRSPPPHQPTRSHVLPPR